MSSVTKILQDKKVGILGFNARPIACSAKKAGALVYVSDYWGDSDLEACCNEWVAVLTNEPGKRQRGSLEDPVHISLSKNFIEEFHDVDFDYVIIGSGFDDYHSSLIDIHNAWGIAGNTPNILKQARTREIIEKIASTYDITTPRWQIVNKNTDLGQVIEDIGLPIVTRRLTSGGGSGIRCFTSLKEFDIDIKKRLLTQQHILVQEYLNGVDISASVMSTRGDALCISIQNQLIGMPIAGRNCDFVYCGNSYPASLNSKLMKKIKISSECICRDLSLMGSNGLDFVVVDEDIFMLEINPRIQGSLELIETIFNQSVTEMHVNAIEGILPEMNDVSVNAMKLIIYSRKAGEVPNLAKWKNTRDHTPEGVRVKRGDPICTIIMSDSSKRMLLRETYETASVIQNGIR